MAGEWTTARLADVVARIQTGPFGSQLHASDYVPSGVPVVMPTNIRDRRIDTEGISYIRDEDANRLSRHKLRQNDLVFSRRGEVDKCALVTRDTVDWLCGTGCLLARPDEAKCDPAFLSFHISAPETRDWLKKHAVGLVMPNLNTEILSNIPLNLPPLGEQRRIASLLGSIDDKIELNRRMAATLADIARALFKSWFIDFDPVRAKMEGRSSGLPDATASLFPSRLDDNGLPKGWAMKKVVDGCLSIFSGGTPSTTETEYWNGGLPWFSSGETRYPFVTETEKHISQRAVDASSTRFARKGCTVIASAGQGNTRGQTSLLMIDTYVNQSVVVVEADPSNSSDLYLFFDLERRYEEFRRVSDGQSSRGSLTTKLVGSLPALLPDTEIINIFDREVQPLVNRIEGLLLQAKSLRSLRDTLLPDLISGKLRIKDAKAAMVAA
ncbi:restriction endonuclease subunit S [Agrobacterium pusense]|uniref:restriction endonuclease subunit S n=1 Tax=Agrobacterium pusense TaxID=648995 RepID=UPI002FE0839B